MNIIQRRLLYTMKVNAEEGLLTRAFLWNPCPLIPNKMRMCAGETWPVFAKRLCPPEATPLAFPVLELTSSCCLILGYASWVRTSFPCDLLPPKYRNNWRKEYLNFKNMWELVRSSCRMHLTWLFRCCVEP